MTATPQISPTRHEAIRELFFRYAHGLDHRDFDLSASIFAPGCNVVGTFASGPVESYWPKIREKVEEFERTMHMMGNVLISDESEARATTETYCVAYHLEPLQGDAPWVIAVRYTDTVELTDEGWKVVERRVEPFWQRHSL